MRSIPKFLVLSCWIGLVAGSFSQAAASQSCSMKKYNRGDSSLEEARTNWPALLLHQTTFAACDDGALGEGYSDAVVRLLANRWDEFDAFVTIARKHPAFRDWALRHIDASAAIDDLEKVVSNASSCIDHPDLVRFCKPILRAAQDALREQTEMPR